jgi:hypothetical protein
MNMIGKIGTIATSGAQNISSTEAAAALSTLIKQRIPTARVLFSMANGQVAFKYDEGGTKRTLLARTGADGLARVRALPDSGAALALVKDGVQVDTFTTSASMGAEASLRGLR